jgi:hypothetical protein
MPFVWMSVIDALEMIHALNYFKRKNALEMIHALNYFKKKKSTSSCTLSHARLMS